MRTQIRQRLTYVSVLSALGIALAVGLGTLAGLVGLRRLPARRPVA